jgi:hypothetical protein
MQTVSKESSGKSIRIASIITNRILGLSLKASAKAAALLALVSMPMISSYSFKPSSKKLMKSPPPVATSSTLPPENQPRIRSVVFIPLTLPLQRGLCLGMAFQAGLGVLMFGHFALVIALRACVRTKVPTHDTKSSANRALHHTKCFHHLVLLPAIVSSTVDFRQNSACLYCSL